MQVIDLLNAAARECGSLATGETLNASEYQDFFERLLNMQEGWNTDRENLFVVETQTLTALTAKAAYQIGPGAADFDQERPLLIQTASQVLGGITESLELVDSTNFASIQDKAATSKLILRMYCDYGFPIATLSVWPVPTAAPVFELYTQTPLPTWGTIFDMIALPGSYIRALRLNLAIDISSELGTPDNILAGIVPRAQSAMIEMRRLNQQFLASQLNSNSTGTIPTVGVPRTTGINLANPQPGGPTQMVPAGQ